MRSIAAACVIALLGVLLPAFGNGQALTDHSAHAGHGNMRLDRDGSVMNENADTLPEGCDAVSADLHFTIHAGTRYARDFPGAIFGMSQYEVRVEPCSRVTITFINEDEVRHQWMVHGLPKYLYPAGMFHIEAAGGKRKTGTFIVPAENRNYLIHCDLAQHMEKGMRGQLVVGRGSGDLWSVTGISAYFFRDTYMPRFAWLLAGFLAVMALVLSLRLMIPGHK
jgi:plastocyanin